MIEVTVETPTSAVSHNRTIEESFQRALGLCVAEALVRHERGRGRRDTLSALLSVLWMSATVGSPEEDALRAAIQCLSDHEREQARQDESDPSDAEDPGTSEGTISAGPSCVT